MEKVSSFFNRLHHDVQAFKCIDEGEEAKKLRVTSVALRIIGLTLLISAAVTAASFTVAVLSSVILPLALLVSSAASLVFAHDFIIVGTNISDELAVKDLSSNVLRSFLNVIQAAGNELVNGVPYRLNRTWVIGPVYKMFNH